MARVPYLERDQLDAEAQEIFDRIGRDRGNKVGLQYRALLHSPQVTSYLTSMGSQLRFKSPLPEHIKEIAILLLCREWNNRIEWTGHAVLAANLGISAASIEAIRTYKAPDGLTENEQIIARFVHQLIRDREISDEAFAAAQKLLGTHGVVDLTLICSYYTALAVCQIALKPDMEPGKVSTL